MASCGLKCGKTQFGSLSLFGGVSPLSYSSVERKVSMILIVVLQISEGLRKKTQTLSHFQEWKAL